MAADPGAPDAGSLSTESTELPAAGSRAGIDALPRLALAQIEVRPGRPDLNLATVQAWIATARAAGAEVVAFPEMCIPGYLIGDLWEVDALVEDWDGLSEQVRAASAGITVVFGNVTCDSAAIGEDGRRRKYNTVRVCHDGVWVVRPDVPAGLPPGCQPKTLQPNYRFFDDDRYFHSVRKLALEQGRSVYDWALPFSVPRRDGGAFVFGVQLCEDIWCQDYACDGERLDTLACYARRGAEAVINLSSSPWTWQKNDKRNRTVRDILRASPLPFLYVNHVGAQNNGKNILVFDGDTTAYEGDGHIVGRSASWTAGLLLVGGAQPPAWVADDGGRAWLGPATGAAVAARAGERPAAIEPPRTSGTAVAAGALTAPPAAAAAGDAAPTAPAAAEMESIYHGILTGLRHLEHLRGGTGRYLIAASGGVDSSVVACLLERAFGPERVFAINMPTRHNARVTQDNARDLAAALGLDYLSVPIEGLYGTVADLVRGAAFPRSAGDYTGLVDENVQARIRFGDVLSGIAAKHGLLFTNNGNKTELALGYCTLYGDLSGAVAPIADLYKVQVFQLGEYLNRHVYGRQVIPANLLDRATVPSAELSAAQDVTQGKGDPILYGYHCAVLRQLVEYRRHGTDLMAWLLEGVLLERLGRDWAALDLGAAFATPQAWLDDLDWVEAQLRGSYFKRVQAPPLIVLSKRAFGFDLRETQTPAYAPRRRQALVEQVRALTAWPPPA